MLIYTCVMSLECIKYALKNTEQNFTFQVTNLVLSFCFVTRLLNLTN